MTPSLLVVASLPLLGIAGISYHQQLALESSILVGMVRTFLQLGVLGAILHPIFTWGLEPHYGWAVVVGYVFLFMSVVAATEACGRSKYSFAELWEMVLGVIWLTMAIMGAFAFGVIIKPDPLWAPQYVIPISGMLLGNCVNAIALIINAATTNLKEGVTEMELYQSFGATPQEASARLIKEAIRVGAMPALNGMAVIGLVSIPGMMTGQILAGNPPMQAAKYQILITLLIANMTFGLLLGLAGLIRYLAFDPATQILTTERFVERPKQQTPLWRRLREGVRGNGLCCWVLRRDGPTNHSATPKGSIPSTRSWESLPLTESLTNTGATSYGNVPPTGNNIQLTTIQRLDEFENSTTSQNKNHEQDGSPPPSTTNDLLLEAIHLTKTLEQENDIDSQRVLFDRFSFQIHASSMVLVSGPSGSGKSQLLRMLAGLTTMTAGTLRLRERTLEQHLSTHKVSHWRRKVRYVGQQKIELLGTPKEFLHQIAELQSWRKSRQMARKRRQRQQRGGGGGGWGLLRRLAASPAVISRDVDNHENRHSLPKDEESAAASYYRLAVEGMPEYQELLQSTTYLIQQWGLEASALDTKWKVLSGGEAQRVHVAIAIASRPRILLLDEATSALDLDTKLRVETSIQQAAVTYGMGILWITHDQEQMKRLTAT